MKEKTFIIPIIRHDFIGRCLETLYENTSDFYVFVIDQTNSREAQNRYEKLTHLWIRPYENLGFSKAINTGILLSQTPYVISLNDDTEFISKDWWQGILDTFEMDKNIVAVNPMSPKEGAWGWGLTNENKDTWIPREGFVFDGEKSVIPIIDGVKIETPQLASEHYEKLKNNHPIWQKNTLCDGLACWATVFKRDALKEVGLFDEKFYPGGGEDYDMMGRIYSCAWPQEREECNPEFHRRAVGTTKSWVWHHWGQSRDLSTTSPVFSRPRWNNLDELWPYGFDTWGHETIDGTKKPYKRIPEVHIEDL